MSLTEFRLLMMATRQAAAPHCDPQYQALAQSEASTLRMAVAAK